MMPLIVKDFRWEQTSTSISISVPIRGIKGNKTNIITSKHYIRIHFHPYIFEVFLYSPVQDENGSCTIDQESSTVSIQLPKVVSGQDWPFLEAQDLDRMQKREIRDAALETLHQRHEKQSQLLLKQRTEERQLSVREQMRLDNENKERIAGIKQAEGDKALKGVKEWTESGLQRPEDAVPSIPDSPGASGDIIGSTKDKVPSLDKQIWSKSSPKTNKIPGIRLQSTISVSFTPREFVTPARESNSLEEEEWLKKQAEARRTSGFNEPDLLPEERDPSWLLEKGYSLLKVDCHLGAVSAFSLGIKLAPKMPELYAARGGAHLAMRNYIKAIEDCSQALKLFTPKVSANLGDRLKCHMVSASAFKELQMVAEALIELKEVQKINPGDKDVAKQVEEMQIQVDQLGDEDSD